MSEHYHDAADLKLLREMRKLAPAEYEAWVNLDKIVGRDARRDRRGLIDCGGAPCGRRSDARRDGVEVLRRGGSGAGCDDDRMND